MGFACTTRTVTGWILVDQGVRFPGSQYDAIANSVSAHDPMVLAGNMTVLLMLVFALEMIGGAAIFGAATGSGRAPGESQQLVENISISHCASEHVSVRRTWALVAEYAQH